MKTEIKQKRNLLLPEFEDIKIANDYYGDLFEIFASNENYVKWINRIETVRQEIEVGEDLSPTLITLDPIRLLKACCDRGVNFSDYPENLTPQEQDIKDDLFISLIEIAGIVGHYYDTFIHDVIYDNIEIIFDPVEIQKIEDNFKSRLSDIVFLFLEEDEYEDYFLDVGKCMELNDDTFDFITEKTKKLENLLYYNGINYHKLDSFRSINLLKMARECRESLDALSELTNNIPTMH